MSVFRLLLWSDSQLKHNLAHHNAPHTETRAKVIRANSCFEFPLNPCGFHLLPWSQTHTPWDHKSVPIVREPPRSKIPGAMWGFGWLASAFRRITVRPRNKEGGMNLISPQCHSNSHVFHTLGRLLPLTLTSPPPVQTFSVPPSHPKCDPLPWRGHIWVAQVSTVWWIQTESSSYTFLLPTISLPCGPPIYLFSRVFFLHLCC